MPKHDTVVCDAPSVRYEIFILDPLTLTSFSCTPEFSFHRTVIVINQLLLLLLLQSTVVTLHQSTFANYFFYKHISDLLSKIIPALPLDFPIFPS